MKKINNILERTLELNAVERVNYWLGEADKIAEKHNMELPIEAVSDIYVKSSEKESSLVGFYEDEDLYEFFRLSGIDYAFDVNRNACILTCDGSQCQINIVDIDNRYGGDVDETVFDMESLMLV